MKSVLLIGLGRFGRHMAQKLLELHHEVMAVDRDEQRVNDALHLVTNAQIGDSMSESFIASLGVRNFDLCVVAIGDNFQSSLETTALLKESGARFVLSRATRDVHAKFLLRNGADQVIYPEKQMADWAAVRYSSDHIFDYVELTDEYSIFETAVPYSWIGRTIIDLAVRQNTILTFWQPGATAHWIPCPVQHTVSDRMKRSLFWAAIGMCRNSCVSKLRTEYQRKNVFLGG